LYRDGGDRSNSSGDSKVVEALQKDKRDERRMIVAKSRMLTVDGKTAEGHFLEPFLR